MGGSTVHVAQGLLQPMRCDRGIGIKESKTKLNVVSKHCTGCRGSLTVFVTRLCTCAGIFPAAPANLHTCWQFSSSFRCPCPTKVVSPLVRIYPHVCPRLWLIFKD